MFKRLVCLVRRQHNHQLRSEDGHVFLQCRRCGGRTPGWDVGMDAPSSGVAPSDSETDLNERLTSGGQSVPLQAEARLASGLIGSSDQFRLVLDD